GGDQPGRADRPPAAGDGGGVVRRLADSSADPPGPGPQVVGEGAARTARPDRTTGRQPHPQERASLKGAAGGFLAPRRAGEPAGGGPRRGGGGGGRGPAAPAPGLAPPPWGAGSGQGGSPRRSGTCPCRAPRWLGPRPMSRLLP